MSRKYNARIVEDLGKRRLRGDYHLCSSRLFEQGDKVRVLDTASVRTRYPKTVGMKGCVAFPYYTLNIGFKHYFIRVWLSNGKFASYFTSDLAKEDR